MSYLSFADRGIPNKVTREWNVYSSGQMLGWVKWYSPWRRYVFYPSQQTLFDAACMLELAEFCQGKTEEHQAQRKAAKSEDERR